MYKRAILDEHDILVAFEDVEELNEGDVDGGDGDLSLNEYFYSRDKLCFMPIKDHSARVGLMQPLPFEVAFCDFAQMMSEELGKPLPVRTQSWIDWYRRTFDSATAPKTVLINGKDGGQQ